MKCAICRTGETRPGKSSVTLERDDKTFIVRGVPAEVCVNCGEEYVDDTTAAEILRLAESEAQSGIQFVVRQYLAA